MKIPYYIIAPNGTVKLVGEFENQAMAYDKALTIQPGMSAARLVEKEQLVNVVFSGMALLAGFELRVPRHPGFAEVFTEIFGDIFGAPPTQPKPRERKGNEISLKLTLTFDQAKGINRRIIIEALQNLYDTGQLAGAFETEMHGDKLAVFLFRDYGEDAPFITKHMNHGVPTKEFALATQIRAELRDAVDSRKWKVTESHVISALITALAEPHRIRFDWPEGV